MYSPFLTCARLSRFSVQSLPLAIVFVIALSGLGCGRTVVPKTEAETKPKKSIESAAPKGIPMWLGNPSRNFYGTGPWPEKPPEVLWAVKTKLITGQFHKDGWGGSSWPGQPSVMDDRVYFSSADGYLYCLNVRDGTLVWSFKTEDSLKTTPVLAGDRVIASGLDHFVYCVSRTDGSLIWKYKTGFEVDGSAAVVDGRVYFGGEDGYYYCLNLEDGALVYKTERLGSMEGSSCVIGANIYVGTEKGDLYCLK